MSKPTIPQLTATMRQVLQKSAEKASCTAGFVKRRSKVTGAVFVQTLVYGFLSNPQATREELAQTATQLGVELSGPGLVQRMTNQGAAMLRAVLEEAATQMVKGDAVAIPLLQRFSGVYLYDSTQVTLPNELAEMWPGAGTQAALKIQTRWDFVQGALQIALRPGREHDNAAPDFEPGLSSGALRLADLGYFDLQQMRAEAQRGGYWLVRLRASSCIGEPNGKVEPLVNLLKRARRQGVTQLDQTMVLGHSDRLPCRLLIMRVPPAVVRQRRRQLKDSARKRMQPISDAQWTLCQWTVYVTNIPATLLTLDEAWILARVRWQIELLFNLWKTYAQLDKSRSTKPEAQLCELYAKLLGLLLQHWLLVTSPLWGCPARSFVKAFKTIRRHALQLLCAMHDTSALRRVVELIHRSLRVGCRLNSRRRSPNTFQLLLQWEPLPLA